MALFLALLGIAVAADPFSPDGEKKLILSTEKIFKVSEAGKDKEELLAIFKAVQEEEAKLLTREPEAFRVSQVISPTKFIVKRIGDGTRNFLLTTKQEKSLADDEIVKVFSQTTAKTYSYVTVLGAKATVRIIEELDAPPAIKPLTQEYFIALLKAGETWTLKDFTKASCKTCFGDGKMSALQNLAECKECGGKGEWPIHVIVRW